MNDPTLTLSGHRLVSAPIEQVYRWLLEPAEQLRWNSLYLSAELTLPGAIRDGSIMTGRFKGSGRATVIFEGVKPPNEFTHFSVMKLFGFIPLGEFHHTYRLAEPAGQAGQTEVTQTVRFTPRGLGRWLKGTIVASFEKRLPESFDEFERYVRERISSIP